MDRHRIPAMDAARGERLLSGSFGDSDPVALLLAAAAAPARPEEIAGEAAAVAAFHGARRASMLPAQVIEHQRRWFHGMVPKAVGLGLAVAVAGIALAAGTGVLPILPWTTVDSPASQTPGSSSATTGAHPSGGPSSTPAPTSGSGVATPSAAEDLVGLCRSYQTRNDKDPGKSMESSAMARLIAAARGEDRIEGFCAAILAA